MSGHSGALLEDAHEDELVPTFRRCALLCVILSAHLLLFSLITVSHDSRDARRPEEASELQFFVELPRPIDTQSSTNSPSDRRISTFAPSFRSRAARDNTITLLPEIEGTDSLIDWDSEASRVARDAARRMSEEEQLRSLDHHPAGMDPPPPKSSRHKLGDSEHFEGGVIIDWIDQRCYYSNQNAPVDAFGQALRLQIPVCTAAGGGRKPLPTLEEWKKERDSR